MFSKNVMVRFFLVCMINMHFLGTPLHNFRSSRCSTGGCVMQCYSEDNAFKEMLLTSIKILESFFFYNNSIKKGPVHRASTDVRQDISYQISAGLSRVTLSSVGNNWQKIVHAVCSIIFFSIKEEKGPAIMVPLILLLPSGGLVLCKAAEWGTEHRS